MLTPLSRRNRLISSSCMPTSPRRACSRKLSIASGGMWNTVGPLPTDWPYAMSSRSCPT